MTLIARNETERKVLEMYEKAKAEGKNLHGIAREILTDMMLDQEEEGK